MGGIMFLSEMKQSVMSQRVHTGFVLLPDLQKDM